jgi:hypothetical protein
MVDRDINQYLLVSEVWLSGLFAQVRLRRSGERVRQASIRNNQKPCPNSTHLHRTERIKRREERIERRTGECDEM